MTHGHELRELLEADGILRCPGIHDALTAKVLDQLDVNGMYMTGYGTSVSRTGMPDAGLITMPEMIAHANAIQEAVDVPVIADADSGFGNATNLIRTVREYIKTGIAGIHIEDQTFPKRCGHVAGKRVIPKEEAVGKIRAAVDVRDERNADTVMIARTDARGATGGSLDAAIDRATAFVEAGADVAFVEGLTDEAELARVGEEVDAPLLYNAAGISPDVPAEELESLGFDVVIYPTFSSHATISAVYRHATEFLNAEVAAMADLGDAFDDLPFTMHELAGFPDVVSWEEQYMPEEQDKYDDSLGADVGGD